MCHKLQRFERWFNARFGWFFTNGNKCLLLGLLLCSCHNNYSLEGLQPPVVVVAVDTLNGNVVVRDSNNNYRTLWDSAASQAIAVSYTAGDTLN